MSTLKVTRLEIRDRKPSDHDYNGKAKCYVWPKGENVIENLFVGRLNRPYELYKAEVVPAVREALVEKLGERALECKFAWRQNAGCSCGCSPGFVLDMGWGFDVFVDVEADGDAAAVVPEAKDALDALREAQAGIRESSQQTGRGPQGNLRNFRQMKLEKLQGVYRQVMSEDNDPEAIEAVEAELRSR